MYNRIPFKTGTAALKMHNPQKLRREIRELLISIESIALPSQDPDCFVDVDLFELCRLDLAPFSFPLSLSLKRRKGSNITVY